MQNYLPLKFQLLHFLNNSSEDTANKAEQ